jgi:hypothetical protein
MVIDGNTQKKGFIKCYGLFWSADEVEWSPGSGNKGAYRLLGRVGQRRQTVAVCDFRQQRGIYVLYDDYGPYYVGLARNQDIGNRLRSHLKDHHQGKWDRFSWFGFRRVLTACHPDGLLKLGKQPQRLLTESKSTIGDIEALLIQALGTQHRGNALEMKFASAQRWTSTACHEVDGYLDKVGR